MASFFFARRREAPGETLARLGAIGADALAPRAAANDPLDAPPYQETDKSVAEGPAEARQAAPLGRKDEDPAAAGRAADEPARAVQAAAAPARPSYPPGSPP